MEIEEQDIYTTFLSCLLFLFLHLISRHSHLSPLINKPWRFETKRGVSPRTQKNKIKNEKNGNNLNTKGVRQSAHIPLKSPLSFTGGRLNVHDDSYLHKISKHPT